MSDTDKKSYSLDAVFAFAGPAAGQEVFRGVELKRLGGRFQVGCKRQMASEGNWSSFVKSTLSASRPSGESGDLAPVVVSCGSTGIGFYRIEIPPVEESEVAGIVRMQAESLLPLPADEMELAWRVSGTSADGRVCTIVAGRTTQLRGTVAAAKGCKASGILLACEGVVRLWRELAGGSNDRSVIIHVRANDTWVLLAQDGQLCRAVTLDVGANDLPGCGDEASDSPDVELFVYDLRSTLELFEGDGAVSGVFVLSDSQQRYSGLISHLSDSGINTESAVIDADRLVLSGPDGDDGGGGILDYVEVIGAGLLALEGGGELDLFSELYRPGESAAGSDRPGLFKFGCIAAAVMLVLCLMVFKAIDKAGLARLESTDLSILIAQQETREQIAAQRPDILDMLNKLIESGPDGVLLDSFRFKKSQAVTISGTAKSLEILYAFEKALMGKSGISDVTIQNPVVDEKKKAVTFRMTFHYMNFTKKTRNI